LAKQNSHRGQGNAQHTQEIYAPAVVALLPALFDRPSDLQRVAAGYGAGQIAGANLLAFFEAKGSKVLSGVGAVSESGRSWSSPDRHRTEVAGYLQGEAGVYRFDGSKAYFVANKRISNNQALIVKVNAWEDVVGEDDSCQQQDYRNSLNASLSGGVEQGLDARQSGKYECGNGDDVTGRRSFHPQIVSRKEQTNGN
jgi:hypothetical protein